jgi:hypothetical protein
MDSNPLTDRTVQTGLAALASVFRMNTRLLINCMDGVSREDAERRPSDRTNSMLFIACHLVDSRHFLAGYLGLSTPNPLEAVLGNANSIEEVGALPDPDEVRRAWRAIGQIIDECFATLGDDDLSAPSPQRFPMDHPTVLGGIGFLLQHESYHVGQMALIRKFLGYPAMKYG